MCISWTDLQWRLYESRRFYRRKGGSTPVPGGEGGAVVPVTPSGGQALVPVPQRQLQVVSGVSGGSLHGGAPHITVHDMSSLPSSSTTTSAPSWASTSHFQYSTLPSLANPSQCHAGSLVCAAPVLSSASVSSSLAPSSHPSLHSSHLPSSTPYLTPQQWLGYQNQQWFQGGFPYGMPQSWAPLLSGILPSPLLVFPRLQCPPSNRYNLTLPPQVPRFRSPTCWNYLLLGVRLVGADHISRSCSPKPWCRPPSETLAVTPRRSSPPSPGSIPRPRSWRPSL